MGFLKDLELMFNCYLYYLGIVILLGSKDKFFLDFCLFEMGKVNCGNKYKK